MFIIKLRVQDIFSVQKHYFFRLLYSLREQTRPD